MRPKLTERKGIIRDFIQQYYRENDSFPSEKDIADGTDIPPASVHRFLVEMREDGEISYDGRRSARTVDLEHVSPKSLIPVLGYVACGPGEEEEEQFMEYIHMPESLIGRGEFFALIAKGKSMVDAGVYPDDYVIVRRQQAAENGEMVVALLDGKNNLKKLVKADDGYILRSMNREHPEDYPDIIPEPEEELRIQGVAVGVYHDFTHAL
ncbi:MAG: hypothetical protein IJ242_06700 [Clostridia bacterium]|nr:hypothetical protein [Clostridia bacterium]